MLSHAAIVRRAVRRTDRAFTRIGYGGRAVLWGGRAGDFPLGGTVDRAREFCIRALIEQATQPDLPGYRHVLVSLAGKPMPSLAAMRDADLVVTVREDGSGHVLKDRQGKPRHVNGHELAELLGTGGTNGLR